MTLNWKTTYFPVVGVNISQTVRTAVACLPLRQLGFIVLELLGLRTHSIRFAATCVCDYIDPAYFWSVVLGWILDVLHQWWGFQLCTDADRVQRRRRWCHDGGTRPELERQWKYVQYSGPRQRHISMELCWCLWLVAWDVRRKHRQPSVQGHLDDRQHSGVQRASQSHVGETRHISASRRIFYWWFWIFGYLTRHAFILDCVTYVLM